MTELSPANVTELALDAIAAAEGRVVIVVEPDGKLDQAGRRVNRLTRGALQRFVEAEAFEKLKEGEKAYPFIMSSGRHWDVNANTQMRDPEWIKGKRACTALMHPGDAEEFGFSDGQIVRVRTEAGEETIELQVTSATRPGYIMIPHGFGLVYRGKTYGANANRLAKNTHRDRIAGTPLHRYIRCEIEAI